MVRKVKPSSKNKKVTANQVDDTSKQVILEPEELVQIDHPKQGGITIVAIGSSAGGLESLNNFFQNMPVDSGCAFILVSHLAPKHITILPELIQHKTTMEVSLVKERQRVLRNCVYVMPSSKSMTIDNGVLHLHDLADAGAMSYPINIFFKSLSIDQKGNAIAIILSGTGRDGTKGIEAIHNEGGIAIAESRDSARFNGMPENAVASGFIDFILAVTAMPSTLLEIRSGNVSRLQEITAPSEQNILDAIPEICLLLLTESQHDFLNYKPNVICRRIQRRMGLLHVFNVDDYLSLLKNNNQEISILYRQILIGVTHFFRDADAFELLKDNYLLDLLSNKTINEPVRIWVAGCSSGEEVYSIAILIQECMARLNRQFDVQIFGTDIDKEAIEIARLGFYPKDISENITQERLANYFIEKEAGYLVNKNIRNMIVFAEQNLTSNPPFGKLDLLCCRNLLIYFTPDLQRKILHIFHYSLNKEGLLFLGSSESLGPTSALFSTESKKWKIFRKLPYARKKQIQINLSNLKKGLSMPNKKVLQFKDEFQGVSVLKMLQAMLSKSNVPASVIINKQGDIIYTHGKVDAYLKLPEGACSLNVIEMAKPGLKVALRQSIKQLKTENKEITIPNLKLLEKQLSFYFNLLIKPLPEFQTTGNPLTMVSFEKVATKKTATKKPDSTEVNSAINAQQLEQISEELRYTKESLQSHIEELETSNEEMRYINEELQSSNEELQSTNEELETSREELQSLNEESSSVSTELQVQLDELTKIKDDIENLLDTTNIACIFLDTTGAIRRFTPKVNEIFPFTRSDIGRPISHFSSKLVDVNIEKLSLQVLEDIQIKELDVHDIDNNILRMRIRPYRTLNNVIDGVVVTFEDITKIKKVESLLQISADSLEEDLFFMTSAFLNAPNAMIIKNMKDLIVAVNNQAVHIYGWSREEMIGQPITMIYPENCLQQMTMATSLCHNHKENIVDIETYHVTKSGENIAQKESLSRITDITGKVCGIVYSIKEQQV